MQTEKYLPPRPGDAQLRNPPAGVVISLMGLIGAKHWSEAIVEDRRKETSQCDSK